MDVSVSKDNLHIQDSYKVSSRDEMKKVLEDIRLSHADCLSCSRTLDSLINEWATHNLCYDLYILRSHTADVDLDYPQSRLVSLLYALGAKIYFSYKS